MGLSSRRVATWHQSQPVLWLVVNAHIKLQTTTCGYCSTHPPIPHPFIPTCTHVYRLNLHSTSHTLNSLTQYLLSHTLTHFLSSTASNRLLVLFMGGLRERVGLAWMSYDLAVYRGKWSAGLLLDEEITVLTHSFGY